MEIHARVCTKDYVLRGGLDIPISKGQAVHINVVGVHGDEEYYNNPDEFDPENFNKENRDKRSP